MKNHKKYAKVIYNPQAGKKRQIIPLHQQVTLEQIQGLLNQYQIPADFYPTKYPTHAIELAKEAKKQGYKIVLAAGGDGTVGEVANGLVGTNLTLGILPVGSFMNVAKMLSIPTEIEKAIELIKIGRTRKIDVGAITILNGHALKEPLYFLEHASLGIEADFHHYTSITFERGNYRNIFSIFKIIIGYYGYKASVILDDIILQTRATLISVANGPITGTSLTLTPESKLNDHKFILSLYEMSKWDLTKYLFTLALKGKAYSPKITRYETKSVKVEVRKKRTVHADSRVFGTTPVEFKVIPNALSVITGFPKYADALLKRTPLDP